MARYKLLKNNQPTGEEASTKEQLNTWMTSNMQSHGLDGRAGYWIKFRDSSDTFEWVWSKDGRRIVL